jgi:hypothetical protein
MNYFAALAFGAVVACGPRGDDVQVTSAYERKLSTIEHFEECSLPQTVPTAGWRTRQSPYPFGDPVALTLLMPATFHPAFTDRVSLHGGEAWRDDAGREVELIYGHIGPQSFRGTTLCRTVVGGLPVLLWTQAKRDQQTIACWYPLRSGRPDPALRVTTRRTDEAEIALLLTIVRSVRFSAEMEGITSR